MGDDLYKASKLAALDVQGLAVGALGLPTGARAEVFALDVVALGALVVVVVNGLLDGMEGGHFGHDELDSPALELAFMRPRPSVVGMGIAWYCSARYKAGIEKGLPGASRNAGSWAHTSWSSYGPFFVTGRGSDDLDSDALNTLLCIPNLSPDLSDSWPCGHLGSHAQRRTRTARATAIHGNEIKLCSDSLELQNGAGQMRDMWTNQIRSCILIRWALPLALPPSLAGWR